MGLSLLNRDDRVTPHTTTGVCAGQPRRNHGPERQGGPSFKFYGSTRDVLRSIGHSRMTAAGRTKCVTPTTGVCAGQPRRNHGPSTGVRLTARDELPGYRRHSWAVPEPAAAGRTEWTPPNRSRCVIWTTGPADIPGDFPPAHHWDGSPGPGRVIRRLSRWQGRATLPGPRTRSGPEQRLGAPEDSGRVGPGQAKRSDGT